MSLVVTDIVHFFCLVQPIYLQYHHFSQLWSLKITFPKQGRFSVTLVLRSPHGAMRLTLASLRVWRPAPHLAPTDSKALPLGPVPPTLWKNFWPVLPQNSAVGENFGLTVILNLLSAFVHKLPFMLNKVHRSTTDREKTHKLVYLIRHLAKINRPQICL